MTNLISSYGKTNTKLKTRKRVKLFGDYGILYLGSHEFLFDSEDYDLIRNRDWYRDKDGYLVNCYYFNGRRNWKATVLY